MVDCGWHLLKPNENIRGALPFAVSAKGWSALRRQPLLPASDDTAHAWYLAVLQVKSSLPSDANEQPTMTTAPATFCGVFGP